MAQVSAGEFRSQFRTDGELWDTAADALSNELIGMIESTAGDFVDPAKRIAGGVRIIFTWLATARCSRKWSPIAGSTSQARRA